MKHTVSMEEHTGKAMAACYQITEFCPVRPISDKISLGEARN
jgi:hypothetical protein